MPYWYPTDEILEFEYSDYVSIGLFGRLAVQIE